jgi:hypothetical protein
MLKVFQIRVIRDNPRQNMEAAATMENGHSVAFVRLFPFGPSHMPV